MIFHQWHLLKRRKNEFSNKREPEEFTLVKLDPSVSDVCDVADEVLLFRCGYLPQPEDSRYHGRLLVCIKIPMSCLIKELSYEKELIKNKSFVGLQVENNEFKFWVAENESDAINLKHDLHVAFFARKIQFLPFTDTSWGSAIISHQTEPYKVIKIKMERDSYIKEKLIVITITATKRKRRSSKVPYEISTKLHNVLLERSFNTRPVAKAIIEESPEKISAEFQVDLKRRCSIYASYEKEEFSILFGSNWKRVLANIVSGTCSVIEVKGPNFKL